MHPANIQLATPARALPGINDQLQGFPSSARCEFFLRILISINAEKLTWPTVKHARLTAQEANAQGNFHRGRMSEEGSGIS
jgi:hypothetical protein